MARIDDAARMARTRRERDLALARVARDRMLIASASRVAAMSLTAYREGEVSLPNVLDAQRTAREVVAQYIDDVATAWNAMAALRVFTLTAGSGASR
jgi:outer membrane protein TolC